MAEVMASMAPPSSFVRVLAAGGTPTADASAGGDLGSIVVAKGGVESKIKGVPDNRRAFFFLAHLLFGTSPGSADCFHHAISGSRTNLPAAASA
jgi:hypothetical protein